MTQGVELTGGPALMKALKNLTKAQEAAVDKAVLTTALSIRGKIVKNYSRSVPSGIIYEKYNPRRTHQASAPGEPPSTDTGKLVNSIVYRRLKRAVVRVSSGLVYAAALEFGTRTIAKRPNWIPVIERERPKFIRRIVDAVRSAQR